MKYNEIIEKALEIIKSYDPIVWTIDSWADKELEKVKNANEKIFVKQVFYAVYRYEKFLTAFTEGLFKAFPSSSNRIDHHLYSIFCYIIIFRFTDIPLEELRALIFSQDPVKMNNLLSLLFDPVKLKEFVCSTWELNYDPEYLDKMVFDPMEERCSKLSSLINRISQKATGKKASVITNDNEPEEEEEKFIPTAPKPFNLSKGKPKKLPEPIKISTKPLIPAPVPSHVHQKMMDKLENERQERRKLKTEEIKKKYANSSAQPFQLKVHQRPSNLEKLKKEQEEELTKKLNFNMKHTKPVKNFDDDKAEVRLTAAAVLRENYLLQKEKKKKEDYLNEVEWNLRDSTEFKQWKDEMNQLENIEKLEKQHIRKVEMEISHQAAIKAYDEKIKKNKENAVDLKNELKVENKRKEVVFAEDLKHKEELKATVTVSKGMVEQKKKEKLQENKKLHDELIEKTKSEFELKKIELEEEKKKRDAIILKIRELERNIERPVKKVDYDSVGGLGLLEEMSLNQVAARLEVVQKEFKEQEEKRRLENVTNKDKKLEDLNSKVNEISQARHEKKLQKEKEKKLKLEKEAEKRELEKKIKEDKLIETYEKIKDKQLKKHLEKKETNRIAREIKLRNQYMQANAQIVEANAWKSNEDGAEREIKYRQNEKLIEKEKSYSIQWKEKQIISKNNKTLLQTKEKELQEFNEKYEFAKKANEDLMKEERTGKKESYKEIKKYEEEHLANMQMRNPFATKITLETTQRKTATQG